MKEVIKDIKSRFPVISETYQRDNLIFITVEKDKLKSVLIYLRDELKFAHFVLLTAVDWIEENHFQLTYLVHNRETKTDIGVRVDIPRDNPIMETAHELWEQVATYQRELKEMFGIDFPGSPNVDEPFILEGWEDIPPYRRDFDTKQYSEETYFPRPGRETHDPSTYMREKMNRE